MDFNPPSPYVITGIQAGWDPKDPDRRRPLRREIDQWYTSTVQEDQDQVYLFVHALLFWQKVHYDKKLSYFQIAGIHGLPPVHWDEQTESQSGAVGYCTHASVLFPTWHRPYVLLYEQVIYEVMKEEIIKSGSWDDATKKRLNDAADKWRLPFWDWAAKRPDKKTGTYKVPYIAYGTTVKVFRPDGQPETPQNPMYSYGPGGAFKDFGVKLDSDRDHQDDAYGISKATSRWAKSIADKDWLNGYVDNEKIVLAMQSGRNDWRQNIHSLADAVYRLFTADYVSNYAAFATSAYLPNQRSKDYISLEGIHNNLHAYSGGFAKDPRVPFYGHMANVPVAAFDPIFWVHHCNVDRLLAIWQTLFPAAFSPNYWFDTKDQELKDKGTWSIKPGTTDTPNTPLAPFHKNQAGTSFDSNDVRSWFALGHTYPELQPWDPKHQESGHFSPEKYLSNVRTAVTDLYDLGTNLFLSKPEPSLMATTGVTQAAQAVLSGPPKKATHDDYIVNVLYDRFHFGGRPFMINIYFDQVKVGDVYNFSAPPDALGRGPQGCENCNRQILEGTLVTGQVPITRALWMAPNVNELDENEVKEYLTQHLRWVVIMVDGEQVPEADYHFLKVSVAQGKGTHYQEDDVLSYFRDYEVIHAITDGKPGGLRQGDSL